MMAEEHMFQGQRGGRQVPNQTEAVDRFMRALDHPLKAEVARVRVMILESNDRITERIKWNAPSFGYGGDDRVTMRLQPGNRLQLIFHRGAKVKDSTGFAFEDDSRLLEWVTPDRAVVTLRGMEDVEARGTAIVATVNRWMEATSEESPRAVTGGPE
jgi:hypothetical protein